MALKPDRTETLASQVVLIPKEQMEPLEDSAVIKLAHYSKDVADYTKLIEALGLEEALCRSSNPPMNNLPSVAI